MQAIDITVKTPILIKGTESNDYLLLAVRGRVGLSFKFLPFMGVPLAGYTGMGGRLRASDVTDRVPEGWAFNDAITTFGEDGKQYANAYPKVTNWESVQSNRAVVNVVAAIPGDFDENSEKLVAFINDNAVVGKLTTYLLSLAGDADWTIDEEVLAEFLSERALKATEKAKARIEERKRYIAEQEKRKAAAEAAQVLINEKLATTAGSFMLEAEVLAKVQEAVKAAYPVSDEAEDNDDDDI